MCIRSDMVGEGEILRNKGKCLNERENIRMEKKMSTTRAHSAHNNAIDNIFR